MPRRFRFHDTREILRKLSEAERAAAGSAPKIVLIGGQAVNYWADRYRNHDPSLSAAFTSKDVDFQAEQHAVDWVARVFNVKARKPAKDHTTEQTGIIVLTMENGEECEIDFLRRSMPNDPDEVRDTAVSVPLDENGSHDFWVMHPLLCMRSRASNVVELAAKYDNEHGLAQLRASIRCLRHFVLEAANTDRREALDTARLIYEYAKKDAVGRKIYRWKGIDPFDAVPCDRALSDSFFDQAYPRWLDDLRKKRDSYNPPNHTGQ